jgi:hypothetical protein
MSLRGLKLILQAAFCSLLLAGSASALTLNVTSNIGDPAQVLLPNDGGNGIGTATGTFTRYVNFSVPTPLATVSTAINLLSTVSNLKLVWLNAGGTPISTVEQFTNAAGLLISSATLEQALVAGIYHLQITGKILATTTPGADFLVTISTTPIPPALLLFGSALAGLGFLGRRSRRRTASPLA